MADEDKLHQPQAVETSLFLDLVSDKQKGYLRSSDSKA